MKCSANISKVSLQIDIINQEELTITKSKVINFLENINNVECKENTDKKVVEVYYKDKIICKLSAGAYVDNRFSFLRKMRFNLLLHFESEKKYENTTNIILSKVSSYLSSINLQFNLQNLVLSLSIPVKPEFVLILTPCESLNNDYRLKDSSCVYIDNDFEERIEIMALNDFMKGFRFTNETKVDFSLKTTYPANRGIEIYDVENLIDKYLMIYINAEQIKAFEENFVLDKKIIKEREFDSLKLQESIIYFDYGIIDRFFNTVISGSLADSFEIDIFDV
jgi:hypothetical protein